MAVLVWALGLVVGLSLGRPVALPLWGWLASSGGSLLLALVVRRWPGPALGLVALAGLGLGLARASLVADPPSDLPYGQTVTLQGQVADRPETRGVALRLRLADLTLETPAGVRRLDGAILLETTWLADWRRGDRLQVTGRLEPVRPGPDAPWETALARQGVHSRLRYPQVVPLLTDRAGPPAWLDAFHQRLITGRTGALPEPQAALAAGLVLGERPALPSALSEAMRLTGTSHLLALSGANLSLLLALARAVAGRLWLLPTLGLLWLFVGLAGPEPSLLRAAVMGTVGLAGLALGRPPDPYTSLALAGALLAGLSPAVLGDPGFQLSVLATLALISLAPWPRDRLPSRLRDTGLAEQVTVQGLTAPVVLALHPQLSLLSLPVNLLLAPIVALALAGTLWPPAGAVLGLLAWLPLTAIIVIVETAADQPLAALPVGPVSPLVWWGLVGALGALVGLSPTSPVRPFLGGLSQGGLALLARLPAGLRLGLIGGLVSSAVSLSVARCPRGHRPRRGSGRRDPGPHAGRPHAGGGRWAGAAGPGPGAGPASASLGAGGRHRSPQPPSRRPSDRPSGRAGALSGATGHRTGAAGGDAGVPALPGDRRPAGPAPAGGPGRPGGRPGRGDPAGDPPPGGGRGRGSQQPLGGRPASDRSGLGPLHRRPAPVAAAGTGRPPGPEHGSQGASPGEQPTRSIPAFWPPSGRGSRSSRWAVSIATGTRRWRP